MMGPHAILFDLDDTLYARVHFVMSGFRVVAADVAAMTGESASTIVEWLTAASVSQAGRELQALAGRLHLDGDAVPRLVERIRGHVPDLRLPALSRAVLAALAPSWRLGIVTNGLPDVQARKVRALDVERLVDTVVYAAECGGGRGKPDAAPFLEACRRLDVVPERAIFVGDDPVCDIAGARGVGMKTIWLPSGFGCPAEPGGVAADLVVASLADVPRAAAWLRSPRLEGTCCVS